METNLKSKSLLLSLATSLLPVLASAAPGIDSTKNEAATLQKPLITGASVSQTAVGDRTVVIALDFLFWDSVLPETKPSLKALDKLIELSRSRSIPLVLGDVPELLPGRQRSRAALNAAIRERCTIARGCHLLELNDLHRRIVRDGINSRGVEVTRVRSVSAWRRVH